MSPTFPFTHAGQAVEQLLSDYLDQLPAVLGRGAVSPTLDMDVFRRELAQFDFKRPRTDVETVGWVCERLMAGTVHTVHPGYLGLFNPRPAQPSIWADRIAAAFNPQICVHSHAPVAVEIENHVLRAVAARAGLPDCTQGHFTSGGSEANATALICALHRRLENYAEQGLAGRRVGIYVSRESHLAWLKIAQYTGLGRNAVRLVATDGSGAMDAAALDARCAEDVATGVVPVLIAPTAGTTNAGVIDPLDAAAETAAHYRAWCHVDAAWAGALIASPTLAGQLAGLERADSVTIDAHKWFATTMGCGMFLTADPRWLAEAFAVVTDYMPSVDRTIDPYLVSMQWSRRFVGLRLFMNLASAGWDGYAAHVEHSVTLIKRFARRMARRGWGVYGNQHAAVACLVPPQGSRAVNDIVQVVVTKGEHWISVTRFEGEPMIRVCVTNGATDTAVMDALERHLSTAAA